MEEDALGPELAEGLAYATGEIEEALLVRTKVLVGNRNPGGAQLSS